MALRSPCAYLRGAERSSIDGCEASVVDHVIGPSGIMCSSFSSLARAPLICSPMDYSGVGLVWCLRGLSPDVQRKIFLLAMDSPSARAFRQYAWQFWPEGFGDDGEQGIWRIVAIRPRRDYLFTPYYCANCDDRLWGRAFRRTEVYPPSPIDDPHRGDADDVARFAYAEWGLRRRAAGAVRPAMAAIQGL